MFDIIIHNGHIVDGTNSPRFRADLGIRNDRIEAIGDLGDAEAQHTIDAAGKLVAPGFVDVHNHSDGWLLKTPHSVSKTMQGFTTEVLMSDGISYAPVNANTFRDWMFYMHGLDALRMDEYRGWNSIAEFMQCIHGANVQNAIAQIPYANVRSLHCGFGRNRVDDFQMRSIKEEIRKAMEEGATGVSTGLDYIVQCHATTDELVEACSAMSEFGGVYVTHVRYKTGLMRALREAVEIGKRANVKVHISHLKGQFPGEVEEVLQYIDTTARHEVDFSFDIYPYQPGSTMLSYLLPYEVWDEGPLAALGKLRDPSVLAHFSEGLNAYRLELENIRIAWVGTKENTKHQGKLLSDYIEEMGQPPEEALLNLLIEERFSVLLVFEEGEDELVDPFLKHDLYMLGTDGIYFEGGLVHPRQFGSVGRLLGPCVRDKKLFTHEEAVHKLSGRSAERFGLNNRGVLKEGHFADVVVFDPETVTDRATYDDPQQLTTGIEQVLVNGVPIIQNGKPVESLQHPLPGRFLKFQRED
ncbi:MAG: D-aminoacylase [Planctomycetes bacterium]|nr:D-aminoacylase [Planctomycetota bacterium]